MTMETLVAWSADDDVLAGWLARRLDSLSRDRRKAVAKRARRLRDEIQARRAQTRG